MEFRNAWYWTLIALLLAVAIGMGYLLLRKNAPSRPEPQSPQAEIPTSTPKTISEDDRAAVLATPGGNAGTAEREAHFQIVKRLAVFTESIEVSGCAPEPLVAQHRIIRELKFTNSDDVAHEIQLDPKHLYKVPAHGSVSVDPNFGKGPGVYGYGCDNSLQAVGILFIVP